MDFGSEIIRWYHLNKRDLPWRNTRDPYRIWLSEIILQQTRVDQGLAYYHRFIEKYPDIKKLAKAKEDDVLKLWQGLGYYTRARNLHHTAREIVKKHDGKFPDDEKQLRSLKGIGDYTCGAILSFAFHKKFPVVDGNVFRLLSRFNGIKTPINSQKAKKEFYALAGELMEHHQPHDFNQAIMEFGSRQCKPQNPDCINCVLNAGCFAFSKKKVNSLPVKIQKKKTRKRFFNYIVIHQQGKIVFKKRTGKDIWKNLFDFPLVETSSSIRIEKLATSNEWKKLFGKTGTSIVSVSRNYRHLLSHQQIHARFITVNLKVSKMFISRNKFKPVSENNLGQLAVPKLVENFLKNEME
ncbi:MAG: A/G-specific adenine glycosylase [Bacteroidetes bacterium]|nr:A/G-specific adenine glycosylase [Bacteroidota bacterium]